MKISSQAIKMCFDQNFKERTHTILTLWIILIALWSNTLTTLCRSTKNTGQNERQQPVTATQIYKPVSSSSG